MKKLDIILLVLVALGCRKQKEDLLPQQIESFVGKWEWTAVERVIDNNTEWVDRQTNGEPSFIVRSDGVSVSSFTAVSVKLKSFR